MMLVALLAALYIAILFCVTVCGASLYDIRTTRRQQVVRRQATTRKYRKRPLITVYIYNRNTKADLQKTLDSLMRVKYRKLQLVVADAASTDGSAKLVRECIARYPKRSIRLFAQKTARDIVASAQAAQKHIEGEFVVALQAGDVIDADSVHQLVAFSNHHDIDSPLLLQGRVASEPTFTNLLQRYYALYKERQYKLATVFNRLRLTTFSSGVCYAKTDFISYAKSIAEPTSLSLVSTATMEYANYRKPALKCNQYNRALRLAQVVGLTTCVISYVYAGYVAVALRQPTLLAVGIVVVAAYALHAVWSSESTSLIAKLRYTIGLPVTLVPAIVSGVYMSAYPLVTVYRRRLARL